MDWNVEYDKVCESFSVTTKDTYEYDENDYYFVFKDMYFSVNTDLEPYTDSMYCDVYFGEEEESINPDNYTDEIKKIIAELEDAIYSEVVDEVEGYIEYYDEQETYDWLMYHL